jgi:hypothetical protein
MGVAYEFAEDFEETRDWMLSVTKLLDSEWSSKSMAFRKSLEHQLAIAWQAQSDGNASRGPRSAIEFSSDADIPVEPELAEFP